MSAYVVTCSGHLGVDGLTSDTIDGVLWLAQGRLGFPLPARVRGEDGWYCYRSQEDADSDPDGSGAALVVERQAAAVSGGE